MKILFCHPRAWGDEYLMAQQLAQRGHQVCMLQEDRKLDGALFAHGWWQKLRSALRLHNARKLSPHFRPGDGLQTLWFNPASGLEKLLTLALDRLVRRSPYRGNIGHRMWLIHAALRQFQPDVVIACEGFSYGAPAALLKRFGLMQSALVVQFIGGDLLDEPRADCGVRRTPASRWLYQQIRRHATLLKPVSPMLGEVLIREGAKPDRIQMLPSNLGAVTADQVTRLAQQRAAISQKIRARYGIAADVPLIISLSNNQKGKGLQILANAWPALHAAHPEYHWLLAGPTNDWFERELRPLLGAAHGITFTGRLHGEDVFRHLAAADVLVNPTLADGLNLVSVEAASVGTPSIVTDKAGVAHWITQHAAGRVIPAHDPVALHQAVVQFFEQRDPTDHGIHTRCQNLAAGFQVDVLAIGLEQLLAKAIELNRRALR
jgi:glycosyltransferase involved in cell wall biosynthesis